MSDGGARPLPVPDGQSEPYWRAASEGRLVLARCARCSLLTHPPDIVCPRCGSTEPDFAFAPVSGRGEVRSWTVVHQSFVPGFERDVPFVLVDVELEDQAELRLIGRLVDGPGAVGSSLAIGVPVETVFETVADGVSIPAFALLTRLRVPDR